MSYKLNKEEVEKVERLEGEVRGAVFKTDENFIMQSFGESGVKRVENKLNEIGHSFKYAEAQKMEFYPIKMRIFSLLAIADVFGLDEEGIKKMGENAPRASFLIRVFTKYFMSVESTLEKVVEIWEKHYTVGKVEPAEVKEEEKHATFKLYKGDFHPFFCAYLTGYFSSVVGMVVGAQNTKAEEKKCSFKGDEYHEFYITWE